MKPSEDSLEIIEQWWKESMKFSRHSNDPLLSLITNGLETINVVLSQDNNCAMESIASFDNERKQALELENEDFNVLRHLVFGFVESFQIALLLLRGRNGGEQEKAPHTTQLVRPKEEPVGIAHAISNYTQVPTLDFGGDDLDFKEENTIDMISTVDDVMENNNDSDFLLNFDDENDTNELNGEDNHDLSSDKTVDNMADTPKVPTCYPLNYNESLDESDGDIRSPVKKSRIKSTKGTDNIAPKTTPQCILCEMHPKTILKYTAHLRHHHKSSLKSNGIYLICSCGQVVRSDTGIPDHTKKCGGYDFSIHKMETTPLCILCEKHPKTIVGYASHLHRHHNSTLKDNGIFLICSCGRVVRTDKGIPNHTKTCNGRDFTIQKIDEK